MNTPIQPKRYTVTLTDDDGRIVDTWTIGSPDAAVVIDGRRCFVPADDVDEIDDVDDIPSDIRRALRSAGVTL